MNTDTEPRGFVNLSATDKELCDRLREVDAAIAALAPQDAALYELQAERWELQQDLIVSKRTKGKGKGVKNG